MKTGIHIIVVCASLAGMVCISPCSIAATSDCQNVYYAPEDFKYQHPLRQPDPEFLRSYRLAQAGSAIEQRNVAVSYDAGYLVPACPEKAHYWYQEAANNGDPIALSWIARDKKFKAMLAGPEFSIRHVPPKTVTADASAPADLGAGIELGNRQPDPGSPQEKYAEYQRQLSDPTTDYGKLVKTGHLLERLLGE